MNNNKKLIIVDISSFIFRAFFAIRPLHAEDGTPVNAVYGVMNMLMKLISEHQPSHIVMARDLSGPSFRHEIYEDYKANRSAAPEELIPQFALIEKLITLMKLPEIAITKYEADDVIGSLVIQLQDDFEEVIIASGDKDLMQFVNDKVHMLDTMKNKRYDSKAVYEKMGVWPDQIVDYLSLVGDTSDNIPGVKGIGSKGAANLLELYKNLDGIFENQSLIKNKRVLNGLIEYKEEAYLSQKLVQIVTDLDIVKTPEQLKYSFHVDEELLTFLRSLKFNSMIAKLKDLEQIDAELASGSSKPQFNVDIKSIKNVSELEAFLTKSKTVYLSFDLNDSEALSSLYVYNGEDKYAKVMIHTAFNTVHIAKCFSDYGRSLVGEKLQGLVRTFIFHGAEISCKLFDITLAAFNLNADSNNKFESLVSRYLEETFEMPKISDDLLSENDAASFDQVMARKLSLTQRLHVILKKELQEFEVLDIFENLDTPCISALANMEAEGIALDTKFLKKLEDDFSKELVEIENKIEKITDTKINLRSPKQVGILLFETLNFPALKKTKTGFSTGIEVLVELAKTVDSDIPELIIKYRELDKLLSTYVKSLPLVVNEETKRVHTHYQLAVASTGRLSSDNPNLQNIPTKTANGRMIRKAFVAGNKRVFVGADYSQVELRILAHYCGDETMVAAFNEERDIHAQTASEIFHIPLSEMTSEIRNKAKAINFGLIYGQSSFGLAQTLGISRKEAKEYIDHYFERFSEVKNFLETLKDDCRKTGYAQTLWGRKRIVRDINSSNHAVKAEAERVAINSPIQGTAADIIKKAMLSVAGELKKSGLDAKLLLQVHDELIVECHEECADAVKDILIKKMGEAASLNVPLKVDVGVGKTWFDLK